MVGAPSRKNEACEEEEEEEEVKRGYRRDGEPPGGSGNFGLLINITERSVLPM